MIETAVPKKKATWEQTGKATSTVLTGFELEISTLFS